MEKKFKKTNLAFLPAFGVEHIHSTVEFAKRLLLHPSAASRLAATFIPTLAAAASPSLLPPSNLDISVHLLPDIEIPALEATNGIKDYSSFSFQLYTSHIKSALATITASALIIDFFATAAIDAANDLHIPNYVFFTPSAAMLSFVLHIPTLHDEIPEDFGQFHGKVKVPGLSPIPAMAFPSPSMNKKNRGYAWLMYHDQCFKELRGILANTFYVLVRPVLSALESDRSAPAVHTIRPVLWLAP